MPTVLPGPLPLSSAGLTWRYLLALGLVALLSISASIALRQVIRTQETTAAVVNVSGRQRMLSQRIALFTARLLAGTPSESTALAELAAAIAEMRSAHHDLVHGNPDRGLPGSPSAALQDLYFGAPDLDGQVRRFLGHAAAVLALPAAERSPAQPDIAAVMRQGPGELLTGLDTVVRQYQRESEADIARLQVAETVVLALTLSVLAVEALLIFRPMVRRVIDERGRLIEAEQRMRAVVDSCHDAIVTIDDQGRIATANPAAGRLFGCGHHTLVGRSLADLVGDAAWLDQIMDRWQATEGPELVEGVRTLPLHRLDGEDFMADIAVSAVRRDREPMMVAILRRSTEQLERYAQELERSNRELDQFAYIAAHDLKAPLRGIANLASWIGEDLAGRDVRVDGHLALLGKRVARMEGLIEGMRTFATTGRAAAPELVDCDALVREIHGDQVGDSAIELDCPTPLPQVVTDRAALWQVFTNLLGNAVRHHHRRSGRIQVTAEQVDGIWYFAVADDGPGIPPEHHAKIFVIFQTLVPKDRTDHLGLGLAVVKKLVDARGGSITVGASQQGGTVFRFSWPEGGLGGPAGGSP